MYTNINRHNFRTFQSKNELGDLETYTSSSMNFGDNTCHRRHERSVLPVYLVSLSPLTGQYHLRYPGVGTYETETGTNYYDRKQEIS